MLNMTRSLQSFHRRFSIMHPTVDGFIEKMPATTMMYKKAWLESKKTHLFTIPVIVVLKVPRGALIHYSVNDNKCRVSKATVTKIFKCNKNYDILPMDTVAHSARDATFTYKVNKKVEPTLKFNMNTFETCATGIHCFFTYEEARVY